MKYVDDGSVGDPYWNVNTLNCAVPIVYYDVIVDAGPFIEYSTAALITMWYCKLNHQAHIYGCDCLSSG